MSIKAIDRQNLRVAISLSELEPGGMERVVVNLAKGLSARGIAVMVACLQKPGVFASELDETGIQLNALYSMGAKDVRAVWRLRTMLKSFCPTVINIHDYTSTPYVASANWLGPRAPILFTAHGELYEDFDAMRRRYRFFSRFFSVLTGVSQEITERHKNFLNWSGPTGVIPNGIPPVACNLKLRETVRRELECEPDKTLFLAVGNPRSEKGFEDLIDATAILRDKDRAGKNFLVVVAGKLTDSDYCNMLSRRLEERGIKDCFRLLGYRSDTAALYSAADVFVLPSRSEGLPIVILESMMAGLPVVATKVGGVPNVLGENGLLVDAVNPPQLADAMERMLTEEGLAEKLGQAGRIQVCAKYGVDQMVDKYIAHYKNLLNGMRGQ